MSMQLGVPFKLLKEFENRKISIETSTGETYRGVLSEVEENMNMSLSEVKATLVDGSKKEMVSVYVKGTRLRLISLPDSAKDSLSTLSRPPSFRGRGRGFRSRGRGFGGGRGGSKPPSSSYERRRY